MAGTTFTFSQIIKKVQYLLLVLLTVCCTTVNAAQQDSTLLRVDTLSSTQDSVLLVQDTVYFNSVFMDAKAKILLNTVVDSLVKELEAAPTDLASILKKMDSKKKERAGEAATPKFHRPLWVITVLSLLLLFLGVVKVFFQHTFTNIVYACFNERTFQQISKEDNILTSWPYIFLYIIFSFSLGLFILFYWAVKEDLHFLTLENYAKLSLLIGFLFVAKLLITRIIAVIFESAKLARVYITVLYLVYFNGTLFLIPLLIFMVFLSFSYVNYILIIFLLGISVIFLYRMMKTLFILFGNLRFSMFYLILYLCALEIAPILILVKALNS